MCTGIDCWLKTNKLGRTSRLFLLCGAIYMLEKNGKSFFQNHLFSTNAKGNRRAMKQLNWDGAEQVTMRGFLITDIRGIIISLSKTVKLCRRASKIVAKSLYEFAWKPKHLNAWRRLATIILSYVADFRQWLQIALMGDGRGSTEAGARITRLSCRTNNNSYSQRACITKSTKIWSCWWCRLMIYDFP